MKEKGNNQYTEKNKYRHNKCWITIINITILFISILFGLLVTHSNDDKIATIALILSFNLALTGTLLMPFTICEIINYKKKHWLIPLLFIVLFIIIMFERAFFGVYFGRDDIYVQIPTYFDETLKAILKILQLISLVGFVTSIPLSIYLSIKQNKKN